MPSGSLRLKILIAVFATLPCAISWAASGPASAIIEPEPLVIGKIGEATVSLDGPWQFHTGDDPAFASPGLDDTTGHGGWEQIKADAPWGAQGHENYTGYAWYRRRIDLTLAPGAPPDIALLIAQIDDAYELYWNGVPVGHLGSFPPNLKVYEAIPPQTFGLGPIRSGVLAIRVYKLPFTSIDEGAVLGGLQSAPILGSPEAIATLKDARDYRWLRSSQFIFGLTSLYAMASLLSFFVWLRDRKQRLLFWMSVFTIMPVFQLLLTGFRLPVSYFLVAFFVQITIQLRYTSSWLVLLWLLQLNDSPRLGRLVRGLSLMCISLGALDGAIGFLLPFVSEKSFQIADAIFTTFAVPIEVLPIVLVAYALVQHKRLDSGRWLVAIFAVAQSTWYFVLNLSNQGIRFTHWQLSNTMSIPIAMIQGNPFTLQLILTTLLFLSIVYAVIRYAIDNRRRQTFLQQEFQNARELQQVLVPQGSGESLPKIVGCTLTSAYLPAQEVGGDFFQIIPLDGDLQSSTLIVLGDVSGKGLKAAMTVSLIVGAIRTLAKFAPQPAQVLTELNQRLIGRMQGGFATCIAMRLDPDGTLTLANAGHLSPYVDGREIDLENGLPLGIYEQATYPESTVRLQTNQQLTLISDGVVEAMNSTGELYGFDRTAAISTQSAEQIAHAAQAFGQDDDITVLTVQKLGISSV